METTYQKCDECSHEFEIVFSDYNVTADGMEPEIAEDSVAVFSISHFANNGRECDAALIVRW